jgi:hypothetical protein
VIAFPIAVGVPGGGPPLLGSIFNVQRVGKPALNGLDPTGYFDFVQSSGGGATAIPCGVAGSAEVLGGTVSHTIGVLGWGKPGPTDVAPLSNQGYIGVEGRSESNITAGGVVHQGTLGLAVIGVTNPPAASMHIGVRARVDFMPAIVSAQNNNVIGLWASINPAIPLVGGTAPLTAFTAVFGDPLNNWPIQFRGLLGGAEADVNMSIDATLQQFFFNSNLGNANLNGFRFMLRDAAGGSSLDIVDNAGGIIASFNSIHATSITGILLTPASVAGSAGLRVAHGVAPAAPVNGDIWTTTLGAFVRINGVTKSINLT